MIHRLFKRLGVLGVGLLAFGMAQGAQRYDGVARERRGDAVLYRETHWTFGQGPARRHLVLYRCADGTPFGRKVLAGEADTPAPDFEFIDARDGYREGVRTLADGAREVFVQADRGAAVRARPLPMPDDAVVDAGFDSFVRTHWARLSDGAAMTAHFLIPSRFDYLKVSIAGTRDDDVQGQAVRRLRMKLDAWYGFALPAVDLAYTPDGQRLVAFEGISTIRDRRQRYLDVRVVFPAALRAGTVPDAEAMAAMAQPLASRCPGDVL